MGVHPRLVAKGCRAPDARLRPAGEQRRPGGNRFAHICNEVGEQRRDGDVQAAAERAAPHGRVRRARGQGTDRRRLRRPSLWRFDPTGREARTYPGGAVVFNVDVSALVDRHDSVSRSSRDRQGIVATLKIPHVGGEVCAEAGSLRSRAPRPITSSRQGAPLPARLRRSRGSRRQVSSSTASGSGCTSFACRRHATSRCVSRGSSATPAPSSGTAPSSTRTTAAGAASRAVRASHRGRRARAPRLAAGHRARGQGRRRHRCVGRHRRRVRAGVRSGGRGSSCTTTAGRPRSALAPSVGRARRRRPHRRGRGRRALRGRRAAFGLVDICAAVAGVWPSADEPVWELPLERWEARRSREPDRDVPDRARLPPRGRAERARQPRPRRLDRGRFGEAGHADYAAAKSAILYGLPAR